MTICIAAMADNSRRLVLAADRMQSWTVGMAMPVQIETDDMPKVHDLSTNTVALTSGGSTFAFDILRATRKRLGEVENGTVEQMAELVREEYQEYRRTLLIRSILEPRGLDLASYLGNQQVLDPTLVREIDEQFSQYNVQVDAIIAGHDPDGCHIYTLTHPGVVYCFDAIGFACLGSGAPHATYHLIGEDYKKSLPVEKVRELVLEAKKKSEKAPGVGVETDIVQLPR